MVPVKEAIESGAWLHFESNDDNYLDDLQFRLRVLSFEKIDLSEVDDPQNVQIDEGGNYWLMRVEVVNLSKKPRPADYLWRSLHLVDQDGFQFPVKMDSHMGFRSKYGKKSGLNRLYQDSLIPKTKAVGAITFFLPDDDEAEYSLAMENGTMREA